MDSLATTTDLDLLFEVRMRYDPEASAITTAEGKLGGYIGSGEGTVQGDRLRGAIRWDLYETIGDLACQTSLAGVITTHDRARIEFETEGFGLVPDPARQHEWYMAYAVQFVTDDERYAWLMSVIGLWEGEFSMQTYVHHSRVFARS